MKQRSLFEWPVRVVPDLKSSGQYPLGPDEFGRVYRGDTHALHVHGYAGELRIGAVQYRLQPGDLTISPAGQPSSYRLPGAGRHWCVHFHPADPAGDRVLLPLHLPLGARRAYVVDRLRHITRFHNQPAPSDAARATLHGLAAAAFQELLLWLAHAFTGTAQATATTRLQKTLDRLIIKLEDQLAAPLRVPALAREAGLSQNYLARQFRQRFRMTIQRYVLLRRMEQAKNLLVNTELAVKAIGVHVGYADPQHFNKAFRRVTGVCPSRYRQERRIA